MEELSLGAYPSGVQMGNPGSGEIGRCKGYTAGGLCPDVCIQRHTTNTVAETSANEGVKPGNIPCSRGGKTWGSDRRSGYSRREALAAVLAGCSFPSLLRAADAGDDEVGWLGEVQRPPETSPTGGPRLSALLIDEQGRKIVTVEQWQAKRKAFRQWWLDFLGAWDRSPRNAPTLTVIEEDRVDGVVRQRVRYEVEPGDVTEAYLLKPAAPAGRRPGVVVFHSTVENSILQPAGVGMAKDAPKQFGIGLARRGYVALCPRNYLWPENTKMALDEAVARFHRRHPGAKGMAKMLYDGIVALNILASLPEVDPDRLGTVGHSLGGKETLYLAAFDDRVRATVSSEGGIGTKFSNWDAPWYLGEDIERDDFTHEHHELLALIAPRPFLLLAGDDGNGADGDRSWPFIEAALPVYRALRRHRPGLECSTITRGTACRRRPSGGCTSGSTPIADWQACTKGRGTGWIGATAKKELRCLLLDPRWKCSRLDLFVLKPLNRTKTL